MVKIIRGVITGVYTAGIEGFGHLVAPEHYFQLQSRLAVAAEHAEECAECRAGFELSAQTDAAHIAADHTVVVVQTVEAVHTVVVVHIAEEGAVVGTVEVADTGVADGLRRSAS